ncbi:MAG: FliM/FliN family flagellar motor switch protein [Gammaproteobacteria bacterium]|nr:FliM/FliN family flagellar motor switch protein [Gammaproteobacteria bacterium]MDH5728574.1 FliM/FliN family flagellar motor switch protein [Gammaproteobacteria bacterium]
MAIKKTTLEEIGESEQTGNAIFSDGFSLIKNVKIKLDAILGHSDLSVSDLYQLAENSVLKLDRDIDDPIDIVLDGEVIARGSLVVVDDSFGVCISEIKPKDSK